MSGEPTGGEGFAWIWVLWALQRETKVRNVIQAKTKHQVSQKHLASIYLDARRDVVNDPDGFAVRVARERVGDDMVLHLAWGLVAGLDSVNGLAGGALQAAVLVAVVVHSNEALEVVLVTTLRQAAHRLGPGNTTHTGTLIARWSCQGLHADGAVLRWKDNSKYLVFIVAANPKI